MCQERASGARYRLAQAASSAYSQVHTAMARIWLLWHSLTGCLGCLRLGFNAILAQLPHAPIGKGSILKAPKAMKLHSPRSEGEGRKIRESQAPGEKTGQEPGDTGTRESWLGKKSQSGRGGRGS